ncbi:MAG: hypothetical protein ACFCVD_06280 [Nodosilinea sp.]
MSTPPPHILQMARQGDPNAIADLINSHLEPKGILAKVTQQGDGLQVLLEAHQVPHQADLVAYVSKGIMGLDLASVHRLSISGRQVGSDSSAWVEDVVFHDDPQPLDAGLGETLDFDLGGETQDFDLGSAGDDGAALDGLGDLDDLDLSLDLGLTSMDNVDSEPGATTDTLDFDLEALDLDYHPAPGPAAPADDDFDLAFGTSDPDIDFDLGFGDSLDLDLDASSTTDKLDLAFGAAPMSPSDDLAQGLDLDLGLAESSPENNDLDLDLPTIAATSEAVNFDLDLAESSPENSDLDLDLPTVAATDEAVDFDLDLAAVNSDFDLSFGEATPSPETDPTEGAPQASDFDLDFDLPPAAAADLDFDLGLPEDDSDLGDDSGFDFDDHPGLPVLGELEKVDLTDGDMAEAATFVADTEVDQLAEAATFVADTEVDQLAAGLGAEPPRPEEPWLNSPLDLADAALLNEAEVFATPETPELGFEGEPANDLSAAAPAAETLVTDTFVTDGPFAADDQPSADFDPDAGFDPSLVLATEADLALAADTPFNADWGDDFDPNLNLTSDPDLQGMTDINPDLPAWEYPTSTEATADNAIDTLELEGEDEAFWGETEMGLDEPDSHRFPAGDDFTDGEELAAFDDLTAAPGADPVDDFTADNSLLDLEDFDDSYDLDPEETASPGFDPDPLASVAAPLPTSTTNGFVYDTPEVVMEPPDAADEFIHQFAPETDTLGQPVTHVDTPTPAANPRLKLLIGLGLAALVLALAAIVLNALLGRLRQPAAPVAETPVEVPAPEATPAPDGSAEPPAETPPVTPVPVATDGFREAVNAAQNAANLAQTAATKAEWQAVATSWATAIDLMQNVPDSSPNYAVAQQKVVEYQPNLAYAQRNAEQAP